MFACVLDGRFSDERTTNGTGTGIFLDNYTRDYDDDDDDERDDDEGIETKRFDSHRRLPRGSRCVRSYGDAKARDV